MPTRAIADQKGVGAGRHLDTDLLEMEVHRCGVDARHDNRGADAASRTDRAEDMNGAMSIITHHRRA